MSYADKMLRCQQCGTTFVFTVEQQRQMAAAGEEIVEPDLCARCRGAVATTASQTPGEVDVTSAETPPYPAPESPPPQPAPPPAPVVLPGRRTGHVKWFDARKGFGFIVQDDGGEIFVHHTGIVGGGYKRLVDGQPVEYEVETTGKGPQAVNVTPIEDELTR